MKTGQPKNPAEPLRVLSYNIHKGFSLGNARFVLHHIKEAIEIVHADLVFLQEVRGQHEHKHPDRAANQFEFLADHIWPHTAYGKNAVYSSGHHGNAVLSKFPIESWENLDVSTNRLERRGILHAVVRTPSGPLHAMCLHLGLFETARERQMEFLCERVESVVPKAAPLIVAGDFNDWRERASKILLRRLHLREAHYECHGRLANTYPSWMPMVCLDRIYVRGLTPVVSESLTGTPWNRLSDHAAVFCELSAHP